MHELEWSGATRFPQNQIVNGRLAKAIVFQVSARCTCGEWSTTKQGRVNFATTRIAAKREHIIHLQEVKGES